MPDRSGNERMLETPSWPDSGLATSDRDRDRRHVLVAVGEPSQLSPLLTLACMLTRAQDGIATLLCVTRDGGSRPSSFSTSMNDRRNLSRYKRVRQLP